MYRDQLTGTIVYETAEEFFAAREAGIATLGRKDFATYEEAEKLKGMFSHYQCNKEGSRSFFSTTPIEGYNCHRCVYSMPCADRPLLPGVGNPIWIVATTWEDTPHAASLLGSRKSEKKAAAARLNAKNPRNRKFWMVKNTIGVFNHSVIAISESPAGEQKARDAGYQRVSINKMSMAEQKCLRDYDCNNSTELPAQYLG